MTPMQILKKHTLVASGVEHLLQIGDKRIYRGQCSLSEDDSQGRWRESFPIFVPPFYLECV